MAETSESRKKVLVVDDEMDMRIFLTSLFEINGYRPVAARDGREGMKKAREDAFDLIVLDVMMPGEGGAVMYAALKQDPDLSRIPVIVLSGVNEKSFLHYLSMFNLKREKTLPDPERYMEKPPDPDTLIECVRKLLG